MLRKNVGPIAFVVLLVFVCAAAVLVRVFDNLAEAKEWRKAAKVELIAALSETFDSPAFGQERAEPVTRVVQTAVVNTTTTFEAVASGPTAAISLQAPPGATAALTGNLTVLDVEPGWPSGMQGKAVSINGVATLFMAGPIKGMAFTGAKRRPTDPDPQLKCMVVTGGSFLSTATLTFELGAATVPLFGNFGIALFSGVYGFCELRGDLVDNIVLSDM